MSEFTGEHRTIYRVRVTMEEIRQVKHVEEGWIPQPATEPLPVDRHHADFLSDNDAFKAFSNASEELVKAGK